ncbi:MAG: transposase [Anaerolineaceae bacterium]|nr:transposase [Anaerolineaceae bacterium]
MNTTMKDTDRALLTKIERLIDRDLALANDFLRCQNGIYQRIIKERFGKVPLTETDRRQLVHTGLKVRHQLEQLITIVKPETLLAWHRRLKKQKWTFDNTAKKPGRPALPQQTQELVLKLAYENRTWGYNRISGELRKLGHNASPTTIGAILKEHGLPPSPDRNGMSWKQFIAAHLPCTWAADFFTEEVWTLCGLVTFYVLFFIHLGSRRVMIAGVTPHPDAQWVAQQARNFSMVLQEIPHKCRYIIHDRDACFLPLDTILQTDGIKVVKTPPHAPQCNAFAERFVREARETLDQIIPLGEGHFRHVLKCIENHHNTERPHQGIGNRVPLPYNYPDAPTPPDLIRCKASLGGLLNHYYVDTKAA